MSTQENIMESLVELMNKHFDMKVSLDEQNVPYIQNAKERETGSVTNFINDFIKLTEGNPVGGKVNYYKDGELDFDTPEEFHRH